MYEDENESMTPEMDLQSFCIQESLSNPQDGQNDAVSLGGTVVPLPGFDDNLSCRLCELKFSRDPSLLQSRTNAEGASLQEFLIVAHEQFDQDEGRPAMDVTREIKEGLWRYAQSCNIPFLSQLTDDEVFRHFKYDHARNKRARMKDKIIRTLSRMLDMSVAGCCEKMENGKIVLNKTDASLALNIIDRIHKTVSMKDSDQ